MKLVDQKKGMQKATLFPQADVMNVWRSVCIYLSRSESACTSKAIDEYCRKNASAEHFEAMMFSLATGIIFENISCTF